MYCIMVKECSVASKHVLYNGEIMFGGYGVNMYCIMVKECSVVSKHVLYNGERMFGG